MKKKKNAVNILGATPLDFSVNGQVQSIARRLTEGGFSVQSVWAMGSETAAIDRAERRRSTSSSRRSDCRLRNSCVSASECPMLWARRSAIRFPRCCSARCKKASTGENEILPAGMPDAPDTVILGESVTSRSLAAALLLDYGLCAEVICPVELPRELEGSFCRQIEDEQDLQAALSGARRVIADPCSPPLCRKARSFPLPHEAYSGRIYRKQIPNLVTTW